MRDLIVSLTFEQYGPLVAKEIGELEVKQAPIQKAMLYLTAREQCISKLKEFIDQIGQAEELRDNHQINENGVSWEEVIIDKIEDCTRILVTLRYLTIDAIQAIVEWRERLNYLISKVDGESGVDKHDFVFIWENENYLIKIKNDT
jgi:hypothetical protein